MEIKMNVFQWIKKVLFSNGNTVNIETDDKTKNVWIADAWNADDDAWNADADKTKNVWRTDNVWNTRK